MSQPSQGPKPKCPAPIRAYHVESGRMRLLPCRRRVCVVCGPAYWRPRVLASLHAGLNGGDYLALLLTAPGEAEGLVTDSDIEEWNAGASVRWHRFVWRMTRRYAGGRLSFWRVAELQARGAIHYHVVMRGLQYLSIEGLREDAVAVGFGAWVGVKRPRDYPGGVHSLGWYFGKYLLKDYQRAGFRTRLVTMSQSWKVGWIRRVREGPGRWMVVLGPWSSVGSPLIGGWQPAEKRGPPWWWHRSWQDGRGRERAPAIGPWAVSPGLAD